MIVFQLREMALLPFHSFARTLRIIRDIEVKVAKEKTLMYVFFNYF